MVILNSIKATNDHSFIIIILFYLFALIHDASVDAGQQLFLISRPKSAIATQDKSPTTV